MLFPFQPVGKIRVTLRTTVGARSFDETKEIDATAEGIARVPFRVKLDRGDDEKREDTEGNPEETRGTDGTNPAV